MFCVLEESHLTYEEMYTMLIPVEICLNLRLMSHLPSCPTDLNVISHGNFLTSIALTTIPKCDNIISQVNCLNKWCKVN